MPSEYDVATADVLYYAKRGGFEVTTPLSGWYAEHQRGSPFTCADWDAFRDPRETTYAKYTALQRAQETYVSGLLERIEETDSDRALPAPCVDLFARTLPVVRYPLHGLQMIAAYVGQMAPSGRIVICAALQAADEMRRVQRIAERMAQLERVRADFGHDARATWEKDAAWQPLRELIERALVTYDWGEAFVALNACIKPALDELVMGTLADSARAAGDPLLGLVFASLHADCQWHLAWSRALVDEALRQRAENRAVVDAWMGTWAPRVARATGALAATFSAEGR